MIVAKNLPGPDYIEFKNVASGLTEIVPDENLRMKGAFNVLLKSYPNFTKEIILNSIDTYIGIVGEEKEKGRTECEELRRTRIGNKEARIKELKESSADILRQIEELKKKNDTINQETLELEEEIRKSSEEIDRKERVFESSVQSVINTLESDKTRVTNLSL
jgi:peptidoglycan hydrolase CwlO-like protein